MAPGNTKVVVRCRPLNAREISRGAKSLVRMEGNQTILDPPETAGNKDAEPGSRSGRATEKKPHIFSFDKSYWSAGQRDAPGYASQHTLYEDLGLDLLDHSFEGFNTCIIAYGQTGSGKSYSMMGYGADKGIIPLTTSELFETVARKQALDAKVSYTVEVSYMEIYNEKVRDLLNPKNKGNLRVREHPSLGPYVEDLSRLVVENYEGMMTLMDEGNKARTVASTNMNETSSRSHAVFTLVLTQKRRDEMTGIDGEKVSKISLVDLAGSERATSTGATGARLKEGANINKSLTTLGKVIAALAQASAEPVKGRKKKDDFVPYRDSVLTWLLKESLGGNSMTAVIAAISPADYEETLSTLRYADAAKKIKTHAVVNEDPNAKLIRELKEELEVLRARAGAAGEDSTFDSSVPPEKQIVTYYTKEGELRTVNKLELQDQLQASEKLMESLNLTWEEKMVKTQAIHVERERALEELGITVDKNLVGLHAPQKHPSLVNLNEDPLMSECLVYQIKPGRTVVGALDAGAHIKLSGSHILAEHCIFENTDGRVTVEATPNSLTMVNGKRIPPRSPVALRSGYRVILGDYHVFRFNDPAAVRRERERQQGSALPAGAAWEDQGSRADSPMPGSDLMDWTAARREAADFNKLGDQDLDKLFDDIVKVRTLRRRPESRAGPPETWSEPDLLGKQISTVFTEDSLDASSNPWGPSGASMTSTSISTPNIEELLKGHGCIEDPGKQGSTESLSRPAVREEEVAIEQKHMEKQLRLIADEMRRLRTQAATRALEHFAPFEPVVFSARQLRLIRRVITKWRGLRSFAMAEEILSGAVYLREANVIANELSKEVTYNFSILRQGCRHPTSSLEEHANPVDVEDDFGPHSQQSLIPSVVVKVIDHHSKAIYTWALPKFKAQLAKMRDLLTMVERPSYSQHFSVDGPFYENPAPTFSFIGTALVSLSTVARGVAASCQVPIMCPYTMEALGSCRVSFRLADALDGPDISGRGTPEPKAPNSFSSSLPISSDGRLSFTVVVDAVRGVSSEDFATVHAQVKLSSIVGPGIDAEDTLVSHPVDLGNLSLSHLQLRKVISVNPTGDTAAYMREGYASIEFFAKVRPAYLSRLERWDQQREASNDPLSGSASPSGASSPAGKTLKPAMRRCETDFVSSEHHDVVAWLEIRELAASGHYVPAEVPVTSSAEAGVFQLHQGLQRRIHLTLLHGSGKALPLKRISNLRMGLLRFMDGKGKISDPISLTEVDVTLPQGGQGVEYHADGTGQIAVSGLWDSSAHDSILLNRKTPSDQTVLVRMTWLAELETSDEPAAFSMDIGVRILERDARPASRLLGLFSSTRILTKTSSVYSLVLSPPVTRTSRDLWRLDTARKHVRGEEGLVNWMPRGVSLLYDFTRLKRVARNQADVQAVLAVLNIFGSSGQLPVTTATTTDAQRSLMGRCVDLWQKEMHARSDRKFERDSPEEEAVARRIRKLLPELTPKLVPVVKLQPRMETVAKSGYLFVLKDSPNNVWSKQFCSLRRPYLHMYETNSERNETGVINLTGCSVILSPDVEMLLERRFAFTIFTRSNSYILHAASAKEMSEWVQVLSTTGGNVGPVR